MISSTMRSIRIHDYGTPEALFFETVPVPQPAAGQVLVKLHSAAVNPADWKMRAGYFKQYMPLTFPWIPGAEGAGIVEAVGQGVTQFKPGDAVFGIIKNSYAEYAVAAVEDILLKPAGLSFDQAASVSVGALTAWGAVVDVGQVQAGQRVLVHGGAGGVGLYALQLAHWKGAHVISTSSADNMAFVKSLGADEVIDYNKAPFETVVKDVDVVIDTVGGELLERSLKVLRKGGKLVTVAGQVPPELGKAQGITALAAGRALTTNLVTIAGLIVSGVLKTAVGKVYPLAEAKKAQVESETRHGRGRIILHMAE
jgi:NADPH:quinone reductase-like Zn-dependent oxidoreductase